MRITLVEYDSIQDHGVVGTYHNIKSNIDLTIKET